MTPTSNRDALSGGPPPARASAETDPRDNGRTLELLLDIELPLTVRFGCTRMQLRDLLKLQPGIGDRSGPIARGRSGVAGERQVGGPRHGGDRARLLRRANLGNRRRTGGRRPGGRPHPKPAEISPRPLPPEGREN